MPGKPTDHTGKMFGRLRAVSYAGSRGGAGALWNCTCVCGVKTRVRADALVLGQTKSCGCISSEKEWTRKECNILSKNINTVSYAHLATLLPNRTVDSIKTRADILGLRRRGIHHPRRRIDAKFFRRRGMLSAYWAGFIAADGCVVTSPRQELRIGLHERDRAHLKLFCKHSGYDGQMGFDPKKRIVRLCVCAATEWIRDLRDRFSIVPRKTWSLLPPKSLGKKEALAYSIGYIDGDGCWAMNGRYLLLVVVGCKALLEWMRTLWTSCGADVGTASIRQTRGCWRLSIQASHAKSVAKLLGPIETPKLQRKWRVARGESRGQSQEV
jgi:hypothetical protein